MGRKGLLAIISILFLASLAIGYRFFILKLNRPEMTLYGNIDIRDVSLAFRVSGRVVELNVDEGDKVTKGQIIARLERDTFLDDMALAKAQIAEAEAAYNIAILTYQRRAKLVKTGAESKALYDEAVAVKDQALAKVQAAKARLKKAETALRDTELMAPSDGTILTRIREKGSIVQDGEPIFTLALQQPVWVRTYVSEPELGKIYEGEPAKVYTDSRPNSPYEAQIGFISPQAEFTPKNVETTQLRTDLVYRLRVIIKNPDTGIRQGMPVTVVLQPAES